MVRRPLSKKAHHPAALLLSIVGGAEGGRGLFEGVAHLSGVPEQCARRSWHPCRPSHDDPDFSSVAQWIRSLCLTAPRVFSPNFCRKSRISPTDLGNPQHGSEVPCRSHLPCLQEKQIRFGRSIPDLLECTTQCD